MNNCTTRTGGNIHAWFCCGFLKSACDWTLSLHCFNIKVGQFVAGAYETNCDVPRMKEKGCKTCFLISYATFHQTVFFCCQSVFPSYYFLFITLEFRFTFLPDWFQWVPWEISLLIYDHNLLLIRIAQFQLWFTSHIHAHEEANCVPKVFAQTFSFNFAYFSHSQLTCILFFLVFSSPTANCIAGFFLLTAGGDRERKFHYRLTFRTDDSTCCFCCRFSDTICEETVFLYVAYFSGIASRDKQQ